jgi:endoglucanase
MCAPLQSLLSSHSTPMVPAPLLIICVSCTGSTVSSPLAISVVWCVYNALPHFLVLWYVLVSKGISLQYLCRFCILLSFFCGSIAVGLIWGLYPRTYSFKV